MGGIIVNNSFTVYTIENAPKESKPLLEKAQSAFGMVPNFHAVIAEAPAALEAYMKLHELVTQTSLSSVEQHIVWMTINTENECHYCTPAHVMLATMGNVDEEIITEENALFSLIRSALGRHPSGKVRGI